MSNMALKVLHLICVIFLINTSAELTDDRPKTLIITPQTRKEFGLPLGTVLTLDEKTQRYEPPPISDKFTVQDRIKLIWTNAITRDLYCKVAPELTWQKISYKYYYYTWCRDIKNNDLCCGKLTCVCNTFKYDCDCL